MPRYEYEVFVGVKGEKLEFEMTHESLKDALNTVKFYTTYKRYDGKPWKTMVRRRVVGNWETVK